MALFCSSLKSIKLSLNSIIIVNKPFVSKIRLSWQKIFEKKQKFVILAFYVKQNTLSKSLISSLETDENCYSLLIAVTSLKEKWARIINHWNKKLKKKHRLAQECKKNLGRKGALSGSYFFSPSATSCLSWMWHTHYHSADKNLLLSRCLMFQRNQI